MINVAYLDNLIDQSSSSCLSPFCPPFPSSSLPFVLPSSLPPSLLLSLPLVLLPSLPPSLLPSLIQSCLWLTLIWLLATCKGKTNIHPNFRIGCVSCEINYWEPWNVQFFYSTVCFVWLVFATIIIELMNNEEIFKQGWRFAERQTTTTTIFTSC